MGSSNVKYRKSFSMSRKKLVSSGGVLSVV